MGMEGCYKCMKYIMVGFNLLVLVSEGVCVCVCYALNLFS